MLHIVHSGFIVIALLAISGLSCSSQEAPKNAKAPAQTSTSSPTSSGSGDAGPVATPASKFTAADVAKLKWIEGTWRGMDGDKPFFERYKLEPTALVVESLKEDGSVDGTPERFELKNGQFGKGEGDKRSAASEITESYIQFVPEPSKTKGDGRNSFRFQRESDINWTAILEWPAAGDKPARQKIYKMEPWRPEK